MPKQSLVQRQVSSLKRHARGAARNVVGATALLWAVHIANSLMAGSLVAFGVHPRSVIGLAGVLAMPLLHASWGHLIANTLAGIPLAILAQERSPRDFWAVGAITALSSGLGAWLFGAAGSVHVGASGVIFGFMGFLMARGWYERRVWPVLLSLFVTVTWGSSLLLVLPGLVPGMSWQAHLFGFLGGVFAARSLGRALNGKKKRR